MRARVLFVFLTVGYLAIVSPMTSHMKNRPVEIKLGYLPHPQALKMVVADQASLVGEFAILRVMFYFGTLVEKLKENVIVRPEYYNMFRTLQTTVALDPYNEDAYYFAQAAFTWELGRIQEVNNLLEYGMKYRTWDHWLPFYAGFNAAYFLQDYEQGARFMQRAAEISGSSFYSTLAARYFYEANQTDLGLTFLDAMIAGAQDKSARRTYELRREALIATIILERALDDYQAQTGQIVQSLDALLESGVIDHLPIDPYGGEFYVDTSGKVRTTSKFVDVNSQQLQ